jgi:hypothetical protein
VNKKMPGHVPFCAYFPLCLQLPEKASRKTCEDAVNKLILMWIAGGEVLHNIFRQF